MKRTQEQTGRSQKAASLSEILAQDERKGTWIDRTKHEGRLYDMYFAHSLGGQVL